MFVDGWFGGLCERYLVCLFFLIGWIRCSDPVLLGLVWHSEDHVSFLLFLFSLHLSSFSPVSILLLLFPRCHL